MPLLPVVDLISVIEPTSKGFAQPASVSSAAVTSNGETADRIVIPPKRVVLTTAPLLTGAKRTILQLEEGVVLWHLGRTRTL
jgi:hypothetical protein